MKQVNDEQKSNGKDKEDKKEKEVGYLVDGEELFTSEKTLTASQILVAAGLDAQNYYLKQVLEDDSFKSYQDNPNEEIKIHKKMKFLSIAIGSMPVSFKNF